MPPIKHQVVSPSAGISCHAWNADKSSEWYPSSVYLVGFQCVKCRCSYALSQLCLVTSLFRRIFGELWALGL